MVPTARASQLFATAALRQALIIVVIGVVVADVRRPMVEEAEGQTGVPVGVIVSILFVRLEAEGTADAGREEVEQLAGEGIADRSLDRIGFAKKLEIIRRPVIVDAKGPGPPVQVAPDFNSK